MFDTFEGFDARDIIFEVRHGYSKAEVGNLNIISEMQVLDKMEYPQNYIIKKGYFPESTVDINEKFCYVNLDMDLYKPTLEGFRFFYSLTVAGGIITVHDYFLQGYEGVNAAMKEFMEEISNDITPFPIEDHVSITIQKR